MVGEAGRGDIPCGSGRGDESSTGGVGTGAAGGGAGGRSGVNEKSSGIQPHKP